MKKLLVTLLIMTMSVSLLVGCGDTENESNKGNNSNVSQDADAQKDDADADADVDSEEDNTQKDESMSNANYESVELKSGNVAAKISYDPEQVKVKEYGNWMTLQGVEKNTTLFNLNIKECESAETYAQSLVAAKEEWALAKTTELEEVKFNNITAKRFTLSYNVKTYQDVKLESLTQEEIDKLEYTLEENTENYYVIEVSENIVLYVAYAVDEKMELLNYITVEAVK